MKTLKSFAITAVAAIAATVAPIVHAQSTMDHGSMGTMKMGQTGDASEMTDGEVRKIDLAGGKITLKHGNIKNLDMPGMTMVFTVKDGVMLDKLKAGDKVKFRAISDGGKFTVTEILPAP